MNVGFLLFIKVIFFYVDHLEWVKYQSILLIIFNVNRDFALHNKLVEQCKERELMPQASFRNAPLRCDAVAAVSQFHLIKWLLKAA